MTTLGEAYLTIRPDLSQFERQTRGFLSRSTALKAGIAAFAASAGAGLIAVAKPAAAVEQQLNVLQATSSATGDQMKQLASLARTLGADLTLPSTSSKNAAEAMTELAKAGLSVNNIMGASKGVLQLSAAGQLSNGEAAKITANALNAFGLAGTQATRVADLLAAAANASSVEVVDVADALATAGGVFAASGLKIEDLVAAVAELGNAGVNGSEAGTQLRVALGQLQAPSQKARDLMEAVGFSAYDAAGGMKSFREILLAARDATSGMTQEARDFFLGQVFGQHAITGINILLGKGVEGFDAMTTAVTRQAAAADLAAARNRGLTGAIDGFKSVVETAAIDIGTKLLPALTEQFRRAAEGVNLLTESGAGFRAFAAGIAQAFGTIRKMATDLFDIISTNKPLTIAAIAGIGAVIVTTFGPASLAIAAIAGLTAALVGFNTKWDAVFAGLPLPVLSALNTIATQFDGFIVVFGKTVNFMVDGLNLLLKASNAVAKATHIALGGMAAQAGDFRTAAAQFQKAASVAQFPMLEKLPEDLADRTRKALSDAIIDARAAAAGSAEATFHGLTRDQLLSGGFQGAAAEGINVVRDGVNALGAAAAGTGPNIADLIAATGGAGDAIQTLADRIRAATQSIEAEQTSDVVKAFFKAMIEGTDPGAAIADARAVISQQDAVWAQLVGTLHHKLGIEVPDEFRSMWEQMTEATKQGGRDTLTTWRDELKQRLASVGRLLPNMGQKVGDTVITYNITVPVSADAAGRIDTKRLVDEIAGATVEARRRIPMSELR